MKQNKIILAFSLFIIAGIIYSLPLIIDADLNRRLISYLNIFLFYPLLFTTTILTIKNIKLLNESVEKNIVLWILCLIPLLFALYFIIKFVYVMFIL